MRRSCGRLMVWSGVDMVVICICLSSLSLSFVLSRSWTLLVDGGGVGEGAGNVGAGQANLSLFSG